MRADELLVLISRVPWSVMPFNVPKLLVPVMVVSEVTVAPLRVPPWSVKAPGMSKLLGSVIDPPERIKAAVLSATRLWIVSDPAECVTLLPALMKTSSAAVGR